MPDPEDPNVTDVPSDSPTTPSSEFRVPSSEGQAHAEPGTSNPELLEASIAALTAEREALQAALAPGSGPGRRARR